MNHYSPLDTFIQNYQIPCIHAAIAISNNDPQTAIQELRLTTPYEWATFQNQLRTLQPTYLRATAYLQAGNAAQEAATEFGGSWNIGAYP